MRGRPAPKKRKKDKHKDKAYEPTYALRSTPSDPYWAPNNVTTTGTTFTMGNSSLSNAYNAGTLLSQNAGGITDG